MNLTNLQFLIDENVPFGLIKLFRNNNITCTSVQKLGWNGYKDIEIAEKLSDTTQILITRDKDFQFLWENYKLRVIHLMIEPATLKAERDLIQSKLEPFLYRTTIDFKDQKYTSYCERITSTTEGVILNIKGVEDIQKMDNIFHVQLFKEKGSKITDPKNSSEVIGYIFSYGKNILECKQIIKNAKNILKFQIKS